MNIDRNDPLRAAIRQALIWITPQYDDEDVERLYLIATRHRDEAVAKMADDLACMSKTLNEYTGIIADLDKQVDRYRADAERLDWVQRTKAGINWWASKGTLREAIDAARAAEGTK